MEKIGILYGSTMGNTANVARMMQTILGKNRADVIDIKIAGIEDLQRYPNLILGVSTWGLGEMQNDWMNKLPLLQETDLKGRKVAFFGLGDQNSFPMTFLDAMGTLYDVSISSGAEVVGKWPPDEYSFGASTALRNGFFVGLALDEDTEPEKTRKRVKAWLDQLKNQWV